MRDTDSVSDGFTTMTEWWVRNIPVLNATDELVGNLAFPAVMGTITNLLTEQTSGSTPGPKVHHGFDLIDFTGLNTSTPATVGIGPPGRSGLVSGHRRLSGDKPRNAGLNGLRLPSWQSRALARLWCLR